MTEPERPTRGEDEEFDQARALLERTVQFLSRCMTNPEAALKADDPRELIRGLRLLAAERPAPDEAPDAAPEPRTIPIRRRRSA